MKWFVSLIASSIIINNVMGADVATSVTPPVAKPVFEFEALPFSANALEPYLSAKTLEFHYGKHHKGYVDNLNKLVAGTPWATGCSLKKVVVESAGKADMTAIFNNAAQAWNHDFFWKSMKTNGGGKPTGLLLDKIVKSFGSFDEFKTAFQTAGVSQFGSGWVWLVQEGDDLKIVKTSNADTPIAHNQVPLLTCDVWEHSYYLDYQNRRKDYILTFLDHLANWDFATSQMK